MLGKYFVFLQEFVREFESTGAVFPTSNFASQVLTAPVEVSKARSPEKSLRVLEVGSGTGAITHVLAQRIHENDELHLCEINPRMMSTLRESLKNHPATKELAPSIVYHECPVQEITSPEPFDFIICSLPFLNFPVELTREIFDKFRSIIHSNSVVVFFEYFGIRPLRCCLPFPNANTRMSETNRFFEDLLSTYQTSEQIVWRNTPPMLVHFLRFCDQSHS